MARTPDQHMPLAYMPCFFIFFHFCLFFFQSSFLLLRERVGEGRREGNPPPNLCSAKIISSVHKVISIVQKITLSFCGAARRGAGARVSVSPSAFLLFSIVNATGLSALVVINFGQNSRSTYAIVSKRALRARYCSEMLFSMFLHVFIYVKYAYG